MVHSSANSGECCQPGLGVFVVVVAEELVEPPGAPPPLGQPKPPVLSADQFKLRSTQVPCSERAWGQGLSPKDRASGELLEALEALEARSPSALTSPFNRTVHTVCTCCFLVLLVDMDGALSRPEGGGGANGSRRAGRRLWEH